MRGALHRADAAGRRTPPAAGTTVSGAGVTCSRLRLRAPCQAASGSKGDLWMAFLLARRPTASSDRWRVQPRPIRTVSYVAATRHPWPCFLFLLPLLAAYEGGVLWVGGAQSEAFRNGADSWLRWGL